MNRFVLAILIVISTSVAAQQKKTTQKPEIGINFSPDYCYRSLKDNDGRTSTDLVIRSRNNTEVAKFGYTTGLNIFFNLFKSGGLETGLQYSNKGYKTRNIDLVYLPPDPSAPNKARTIYSYSYIGIPLKVKFIFGTGKIRFPASAGFMTSLLLKVNQKSIYGYANGNTEKKDQSITSSFKKADVSPQFSIGVDYRINRQLHLAAEPTFRFGLINTMDGSVSEKLWSAGLNLVCYFNFTK